MKKNKPKLSAMGKATQQAHGLLRQVHGLLNQNELTQAQALLAQCLVLAPDDLSVLNTQAVLAARQHDLTLAEQIWLRLIALKKADASTYSNLGNLYQKVNRFDEAEQMLGRAIQLDPKNVDVNMNLGVVYYYKGLNAQALAQYDKCLKLAPNSAKTYFNKACLLQQEFNYKEAFACYRQALRCDAAYFDAYSNMLMIQHYATPYSPYVARDEAVRYAQLIEKQVVPKSHANHDRTANRKLNIGFVSADLRRHSVGWFLKDVLLAMNTQDVNLFAYHNSNIEDAITAQLKPVFATWRDVSTLSDNALIACIAQDKIDILIDLSGYTAGNRFNIFAQKAAPIQVNWLGYFATTGLSTMDYIVSDATCLPDAERDLYVEQPWHLPHSRLHLFKPQQVLSSPLPCLHKPFTFGCFQDLAKINDDVLRVWAQILKQSPHAHLRIQCIRFDSPATKTQFMQRLTEHGFDLSRVQLLGKTSLEDYLAAYAQVDVILDTFPFPGGTTTVEALWNGVPTLTLTHAGMLGRQGQALLSAVGLADWVCLNTAQYIEHAVTFASGHQKIIEQMQHLRHTLPEKCAASSAANAQQFARDLTLAWQAMWGEYVNQKHSLVVDARD